jgi:hypothetical protein
LAVPRDEGGKLCGGVVLDIEYVQFCVRRIPKDPVKAEVTRGKMLENVLKKYRLTKK